MLIFAAWTSMDAGARDGELSAARCRKRVRDWVRGVQLLPGVDVEILLFLLLDHVVVRGWAGEMVPVWAARVMVTACGKVADAVDVRGGEARDGDGGIEV